MSNSTGHGNGDGPGGRRRRSALATVVFGALLVVLSAGVVAFLMQAVGPLETAPEAATEQAEEPTMRVVTAREYFEGSGKREVLPGVPSVAPSTPWLKLDQSMTLTRIGVGSCLGQNQPQPIWEGVLRLEPRPQLFMMIGDSVYGDIKSPAAKELVQAYRDQAARPELAKARQAMPFIAMWDDHDYGRNDAGGNFSQKGNAARLFHDFWQMEPERPVENGIYYARTYGSEGRRVQIIMLDTRSMRSEFQRKSDSFKHWGKFEPIEDPERTMLGNAQWEWLEERFQEPADVRIIVSSIQLLAEGHGFERWGNLPLERQRFFNLINDTGARGVILLSGDRHSGAFYSGKLANGQTLAEMTTSSLNRSYAPPQDARTPERLSQMYNQENFGLVDIDWRQRKIELLLKDIDGETLDGITVKFADLGIDE
ncbi:MAG: alkaline phosphatase family protein [Alphaproteobacteria bacterium]|nr:alkaline phosphatase family protein [Alphaproteobacteria bacterium]